VNVTAVVDCGQWSAGRGPLLPLGAEPMVVRAVCTLLDLDLVEQVEVRAPGEWLDAVERACRGLPVSVRAALAPIRPHVDQRAEAPTGDGSVTTFSGGIVLWHEATRPLAPPDLARAVLDAVRSGHAAAVPVLPVTDTVKQVGESDLVVASPDRTMLRALQTPIALRGDVLPPGSLGGSPLSGVARLVESDVPVHCVDGHPLAFPVRTAWDLELARMMMPSGGSR
jgi:2-C-methyl-D-erythritol 4-phosphate cytidylyltransferase